jgi:hypothetical protein
MGERFAMKWIILIVAILLLLSPIYANKWLKEPKPDQGAQECTRRLRQIEKGQLKKENGLLIKE